MNPRHLGDLVTDGEHRVQRGHRLLKDHRDAIASNLSHPCIVQCGEILPLEANVTSFLDPPRGLNQSQDRQRSDRLAASRLADDAEGFARQDVE